MADQGRDGAMVRRQTVPPHLDPTVRRLSLHARLTRLCGQMRMALESLEKHSGVTSHGLWVPIATDDLYFQRQAHSTLVKLSHYGTFVLGLDVTSRVLAFTDACEEIDFAVRQDNREIGMRTYDDKAFERAYEALATVNVLLEEAPAPPSVWPVVVPDTNVLVDIVADDGTIKWERLQNDWENIVLAVVPPVVRELDTLKVRSDKGLRGRVQQIVRTLMRISEFNNPHATDRISVEFVLNEVAVRERKRLVWFDATRMDHHILAAALDVERRWFRSSVFVATSDLHMRLLAKSLDIAVWPMEREGDQ